MTTLQLHTTYIYLHTANKQGKYTNKNNIEIWFTTNYKTKT